MDELIERLRADAAAPSAISWNPAAAPRQTMQADDPILRLIEALARLDAEDYLRAEAANDAGSEPGAENPALPATGTSA